MVFRRTNPAQYPWDADRNPRYPVVPKRPSPARPRGADGGGGDRAAGAAGLCAGRDGGGRLGARQRDPLVAAPQPRLAGRRPSPNAAAGWCCGAATACASWRRSPRRSAPRRSMPACRSSRGRARSTTRSRRRCRCGAACAPHGDAVRPRRDPHADRRRLRRVHAVRPRLPRASPAGRAAPAPPVRHPGRAARRPAGGLGPAADAAGLGRRTAQDWRPGEAGARRTGDAVPASICSTTSGGGNLPGQAGTSMLSPHLHWGEISPVQVWHVADRHGSETGPAGRDAFLNELLWREFAAYLLWHHPTLPERPLRPEFARMPWRRDKAGLAAWQRGRTGVPIVDAGMRQLWHTGWMHNRVRMIVASFLVKHLLMRWQDGEAWFWDTLVRRRPRSQRRELAVGRRLRRRRGTVLPRVQPGAPGAEIRSARHLCTPFRPRTGGAGRAAHPRAVGRAGDRCCSPPASRSGRPIRCRSSIWPRVGSVRWTPSAPSLASQRRRNVSMFATCAAARGGVARRDANRRFGDGAHACHAAFVSLSVGMSGVTVRR